MQFTSRSSPSSMPALVPMRWQTWISHCTLLIMRIKQSWLNNPIHSLDQVGSAHRKGTLMRPATIVTMGEESSRQPSIPQWTHPSRWPMGMYYMHWRQTLSPTDRLHNSRELISATSSIYWVDATVSALELLHIAASQQEYTATTRSRFLKWWINSKKRRTPGRMKMNPMTEETTTITLTRIDSIGIGIVPIILIEMETRQVRDNNDDN